MSVTVKSAGSWTDEEMRDNLEARCMFIDDLLSRYPDSPDMVWCQALAVLLDSETVWINAMWWREDLPKEARKLTGMSVTCNDVFAWGCSDGEDMLHEDIIDVYRHWRKDPAWGSAAWCIKRRKQMPQPPVEKRIRAGGIWNLDDMDIGPNTMEAEVQATLRAYVANKAVAGDDTGEQVRSANGAEPAHD